MVIEYRRMTFCAGDAKTNNMVIHHASLKLLGGRLLCTQDWFSISHQIGPTLLHQSADHRVLRGIPPDYIRFVPRKYHGDDLYLMSELCQRSAFPINRAFNVPW